MIDGVGKFIVKLWLGKWWLKKLKFRVCVYRKWLVMYRWKCKVLFWRVKLVKRWCIFFMWMDRLRLIIILKKKVIIWNCFVLECKW